ncbi:c-Myc-binding protein-like [Homalodisca vitripennis]|uniref:c-Myc-binding protein-like n=1 Tax=Homalodisca vitripennis TaxID=197043 RepID=UPI001EEA28AB|nr:c-Myc-binding protein-like [Homalodisca vitripennis]XP_046670538.1 c-Myc-binding protein-like [Homalodisca vitripennis]
MSSYRPLDSKREEFRKYLEKAGAMDALTKVLVMLYDEPEKPADALEYIRKHLGDNRPEDVEVGVLKTDLEAAITKIQTLEGEIQVLKERLEKYEPEEKHATEEEGGAPVEPTTDAEPSAEEAPAEPASATAEEPPAQ